MSLRDEQALTLLSADGEAHTVSLRAARESGMLSGLLEHAGGGEPVRLSRLYADSLSFALEFCQLVARAADRSEAREAMCREQRWRWQQHRQSDLSGDEREEEEIRLLEAEQRERRRLQREGDTAPSWLLKASVAWAACRGVKAATDADRAWCVMMVARPRGSQEVSRKCLGSV